MAIALPPPGEWPEHFRRAVASLHDPAVRPEVVLTESAAPQRLAPFAVALHGDVVVSGEELASGRLIVLHDPAGQDPWEGTTRLVTYVRAPLDPEMGSDPLLPSVGWSWLVDALNAARADYAAAGGTVTRVTSERFGALADQPDAAELELRASWSPVGEDLGPHLTAFAELLCSTAGLPPSVPGVVPMATPRRTAKRAPARRS